MLVLFLTAASKLIIYFHGKFLAHPSSSSSLSPLLKPSKRLRRKSSARVLTGSSYISTAPSVQQPRHSYRNRRQVSPRHVTDLSQGTRSIRPEEIFDAVCSGKSAMVVSTLTVGRQMKRGGAKTRIYNEKNRALKQQ